MGISGMQGEKGPPGMQGMPGGGAIYTRWGQTACPADQGTELVYVGRAGGTDFRESGGASNYLCMPDDPDYLQSQSDVQDISHVVGVEYFYAGHPLSPLNFHNVPCAVCYVSTRSVSLMIPAKTVCPDDWTLEYIGYLMADNNVHTSRMTYECVDIDPQSIPGLEANGRSSPVAYFQIVEAVCGGLACSPYNAEAELTCVVCTR